MTIPAGAPVVAAVPTGGFDRTAWSRSRYRALVQELRRRGYPLEVARMAARAGLAQWARETGWGHSEYNGNVGNIRPTGMEPRHILSDGLDYRAYPSLEAGIVDAVNLLHRPRYAEAWQYLLQTGDPPGWYDRVMRAGWNPWTADGLAEYRGVLTRLDRELGDPVALTADLGGAAPRWVAPAAAAVGGSALALCVWLWHSRGR